jgi:hypothetical protein
MNTDQMNDEWMDNDLQYEASISKCTVYYVHAISPHSLMIFVHKLSIRCHLCLCQQWRMKKGWRKNKRRMNDEWMMNEWWMSDEWVINDW